MSCKEFENIYSYGTIFKRQNLSRNDASLKVLPGVNIRQNKTLEIHIPEVNLYFKTNDIDGSNADVAILNFIKENRINSHQTVYYCKCTSR